jgi:IPT/TIG domain
VLAGIGCYGASARSSAEAADGHRVPRAIADDCSKDVTKAMSAWIVSVPDGSTLSFTSRACYRIEGTLELTKRRDLDFDGNGAIFRSLNPPDDKRSFWRIIDSDRITLRDMTIDGSYKRGGTFAADLQHAHAVEAHGSSLDIVNVKIRDFAGDCIYFGAGYTFSVTLSSGTVKDSSCKRTGRNAVSVLAGENILVRGMRTDAIGYDVFDVEPNPGAFWGSNGVTFDGNTIGSYAKNAYSIVASAPITNQFFTNNRVLNDGLKIGIADPMHAGYRPKNVTIANNTSNTPQTPSAMNFDNVDGLTVIRNHVPMTGGPMAAVRGSCELSFADNTYPGGSTQALIYPWICAFAPTEAEPGTKVTIRGSGFNQASRVAIGRKRAPFKLESGTTISMVVPRGATTGRIRVKAPNGTATTLGKFTVLGAP